MQDSLTIPKGFLAAGIHCGIKESAKFDLAMLSCPSGARAGAVFTTNKIVSAAVELCRENVKTGKIHALIANSGVANACTGQKGMKNAQKMCEMTAKALDIDPRSVLIASTGVIGSQLPMDKIIPGITTAAKSLAGSHQGYLDFAKAIMTTDTKPKQSFAQVKIGSETVNIAGAVKGAGMIAPNMATTLCFITTDADISASLLKRSLCNAIDQSLNRLTVDSHQSTNDTAVILASGLAQNRPIKAKTEEYEAFSRALEHLCRDLACQMALDAEGATRMFTVVVTGAATKAQARKAARAVADYPLVKCAVNGADPNWGRIICAVGSCGVSLNPAQLSCKLDSVTVFRNGGPVKFDQRKAAAIVGAVRHTITVDLGAGTASDFCIGCDMSKEYVEINAEYHT